jgi:hypothetical protein
MQLMQRYLTVALILALAGIGRAAEAPVVVAAGEWSKPVVDSRARALRGRLVICRRTLSPERREFAVYVELQDATESVGGTMRLYCDFGRTDFRPEYKGGLHCDLRDKDQKPVKSAPFPFSGAVPGSQWVTLPSDATIRLRSSPWGIHRPDAMAISPDLGALWIIADNDPNDYFLSGTFVIDPPADRVEATNDHVWRGTITLPAVRIVNRR